MAVFCRAVFNYASPDEGGLAGVPLEMDVHDGRAEPLPGWRDCGFELVRRPSAVEDWSDDSHVESVHYAEIEALARELTGCDAALVSDHVRRTGQETRGERDQAPVNLVHSDFAENYAEVVRGSYHGAKGRGARTLERNGVTAEDVEGAGRIVMMQFWRNLGPSRMDLPLAWCDTRTVDVSEVRPFHYTGYVAGGRSFDALAVCAPDDPERHQWYCFPEMTADEVVAFRTYDTDLVGTGRTFFTPHSAFRDPDVEPGRPARTSVELRVACLFR